MGMPSGSRWYVGTFNADKSPESPSRQVLTMIREDEINDDGNLLDSYEKIYGKLQTDA